MSSSSKPWISWVYATFVEQRGGGFWSRPGLQSETLSHGLQTFLMALPEQGCLAAVETLTTMCGGRRELSAHGEDPMGSRGSMSRD